MRHGRMIRLSPGIEAQIRRMARADSRTYEDELEHLVSRGLTVSKEHSTGEDACIIAQLAYLREEPLEARGQGSSQRRKPRSVRAGRLNWLGDFLRILRRRKKQGS